LNTNPQRLSKLLQVRVTPEEKEQVNQLIKLHKFKNEAQLLHNYIKKDIENMSQQQEEYLLQQKTNTENHIQEAQKTLQSQEEALQNIRNKKTFQNHIQDEMQRFYREYGKSKLATDKFAEWIERQRTNYQNTPPDRQDIFIIELKNFFQQAFATGWNIYTFTKDVKI